MPTYKSIVLERGGEKDGFEQRFGQVIPDGSLVVIEGEEGTGKSIFCQRFCFSFLRNGYTCSYVSTQYTIKSFLRQVASVGYDMKEYLMKGKLFFISTEVMLAETLPRKTFFKSFITAKKIFEPEIIFVDSLSTLLKESIDKENLVELISFFNRLKGSGKIIFITINPKEWDEEINHEFRMITDIHFLVARETKPGLGIVHNIYLKKFNGAVHKYEPVTTFSVRPGVGLTIETTSIAF